MKKVIILTVFLFSGCVALGVIPAQKMEGHEQYNIKLTIYFTPAGKPIPNTPLAAAGRTYCQGLKHPVVFVKGWKYKNKILPEDIYAVGFEVINSLHCLYPSKFVNIEMLPDGWGIQ